MVFEESCYPCCTQAILFVKKKNSGWSGAASQTTLQGCVERLVVYPSRATVSLFYFSFVMGIMVLSRLQNLWKSHLEQSSIFPKVSDGVHLTLHN